jgi:hypothetical protein
MLTTFVMPGRSLRGKPPNWPSTSRVTPTARTLTPSPNTCSRTPGYAPRNNKVHTNASNLREEFRTLDRLAMQFFWSYFLIGVDSCVSRLREINFYTDLLRDVGFHDIEILPGPFELIRARKRG